MTVLTPVYICFFLGLVQSPQDGQASAAQIVEALSQGKGIGRKAALDELIRSKNRKWTPADADKLVDGLVICLRSAWLRTNAASELANLAREYPSQVARAVPEILDYLPRDETGHVSRSDVCELIIVLGTLGENARQAAPRLRHLASRSTSSPYVAAWAAGALPASSRTIRGQSTRYDDAWRATTRPWQRGAWFCGQRSRKRRSPTFTVC